MAGTNRYTVSIVVDLDTGKVKSGGQELDHALDQISRRELLRRRKLNADQLKDVQKFSRDQGRVMDAGAREVAHTYEKQLGRSFFSRLAREASSAFKNNFSVGGIGGAGGGGVGGLIGGALSVAGGNFITSILGGVKDKITGAIQTGFDFNKIKEQTLLGFEIKLKGRREAENFFAQIAQKATELEQELPQTLDTVQRLMSAFNAPQALRAMVAINDAVASTGKSGGEAKEQIDGIGLALQQIIFKNKVSAEEITQLNERQINAWKYLGQEIAKTDQAFAALTDEEKTGRVQEMAQRGMLNAKTAVAVIIRGMEKEFGGTSARIARETLAGIESNTSDRLSQLAGKSTEAAFERYKLLRQKFLDTLNSPVGDRAAGGINATADTFVKGLDSVFDAVNKGDFKSLGFEAISSAASGVIEGGKSLYQSGVNAAGQLEQGIRDRLEMNSPSQVMLDLGMNAGLSFQQGFAQSLRRGGFSDEIDRLIEENARRTGLDPNLIRSMMKQESGGNRRAVSNKGASGLMQLMPATARSLGVTNIFDPAQNIRGGTDYMAMLMQRFGGDTRKALAGYNAGPGRVDQFGGVPPPSFAKGETYNYVRSIMADYERRQMASGASGGSWRGAFGAQGRAMEIPEGRPFGAQGRAMPVYVVNVSELAGLRGRDAREHGGLDGVGARDAYEHGSVVEQYRKVPVYDPTGKRIGFDAIPPGELPVIERSTQNIIGMLPALDGVRASLGQTKQAIDQVGASGQDAFGNLPPLINTAAAEAKEEAKEFKRMAEDIVGAFGGGFEELLRGRPREAIRALRQDFASMLIGMARDWFQSSIFGAMNGKEGTGGGLLGSIRRFLGMGGSSSSASNSGGGLPFTNSGSSAALGSVLSGAIYGGGISAPQSISAKAESSAAIKAISDLAQGNVTGAARTAAGNTSRLGSFLGSPGVLPGIGIGAGLGASLGGQSRAGQIAGLVGGGLFGAAAGSIAAGVSNFGLGVTLATTSALTFATLGIGAAAVTAAIILGRNAQRRRDETTRNTLATDLRSQLYNLISQVNGGRLDGAQALSQYQELRGRYVEQASGLKDRKARDHAMSWLTRDLEGQVLPKLHEAIARQRDRAAISSQLHATFADGGAVHPMFRHNPLGYVSGPGSARSDSIMSYFPVARQFGRISNTEYVLDAETTRNITVPRLDMIRASKGKGFADGGAVLPAGAGLPSSKPIIIEQHNHYTVTLGSETFVELIRTEVNGDATREVIIKTAESRMKRDALRRS